MTIAEIEMELGFKGSFGLMNEWESPEN